jgi:hypothetical protein
MEPIAIVKKRSRIWLIVAVLIVALLLIAAALWFIGDTPTSEFTHLWHHQQLSSAAVLWNGEHRA